MTMLQEYFTISDDESVSFVQRKAWSKAGNSLEEVKLLEGYKIFKSMVTIGGIYLILIDMDLCKYTNPEDVMFKIVKITTDEETGKIEIHSMEVTEDQAHQFMKCGPWLENTDPGLFI